MENHSWEDREEVSKGTKAGLVKGYCNISSQGLNWAGAALLETTPGTQMFRWRNSSICLIATLSWAITLWETVTRLHLHPYAGSCIDWVAFCMLFCQGCYIFCLPLCNCAYCLGRPSLLTDSGLQPAYFAGKMFDDGVWIFCSMWRSYSSHKQLERSPHRGSVVRHTKESSQITKPQIVAHACRFHVSVENWMINGILSIKLQISFFTWHSVCWDDVHP